VRAAVLLLLVAASPVLVAARADGEERRRPGETAAPPGGPSFIAPPAGADVAEALVGPVGPSAFEVAAEVRRRGFWAGRAIGDEACAGCHPDVAAQWRASAHRFSSFNNPYYRLAAEEVVGDRGPEAARFCAACHEPVLAATRLATTDEQRAEPRAQAGITCMACHAIEAAEVAGDGRYRARPDGAFPLDQPFHRARLRPAVLAEPRLCGACHDVTVPATLTAGAPVRSQTDFEAWLASPFAAPDPPRDRAGGGPAGRDPGAASARAEGAGAEPPPASARCQDCHMPLEPAPNDLGAKEGLVRSHRFLTANAALPHLRGDAGSVARVRAFLAGSVSLELAASPGRADVTLLTRRVGHRFPGGTMDSNQVWLEVKARDARSRLLAASGVPDERGRLPPDAHLVRAQAVDAGGRPIARRDLHRAAGIVFDHALDPFTPRRARYALPPATALVEARLLYRKFSADYAEAACRRIEDPPTRRRCEDIPVIEIAAARAAPGRATSPAPSEAPTPSAPPPRTSASPALAAAWRALHPEAAAEADADHTHELHAKAPPRTLRARTSPPRSRQAARERDTAGADY
jgi:hypothetical protein